MSAHIWLWVVLSPVIAYACHWYSPGPQLGDIATAVQLALASPNGSHARSTYVYGLRDRIRLVRAAFASSLSRASSIALPEIPNTTH